MQKKQTHECGWNITTKFAQDHKYITTTLLPERFVRDEAESYGLTPGAVTP